MPPSANIVDMRIPRRRGLLALAAVASATLASAGLLGSPAQAQTAAPSFARAAVPHFDHVVVTFMENEDATSTFEDPSAAPNLAALRRLGSYLPDYYGVGHASLDNYIALFGGEQPTTDTEGDCLGDAVQDCEFPASVPTLGSSLDAAKDSWKIYSEGEDEVGVAGAAIGHSCLHQADPTLPDAYQGPGTAGYATRHNPAMWYDSVIDKGATVTAGVAGNSTYCDAHSVDYTQLATDDQSPTTLPTFSFVQPDTCHDGHDDSQEEGYCTLDPEGATAPYGVAAINDWLGNGAKGGTGFVSSLLDSPAWRSGSNLLVITFDEAIASGTGADATGCTPCHDGSDGGRIGAIMIGTGVKAGYVSTYRGDHYGLLRTIEDSERLPTLSSQAVSAAAASTVHDGAATPITDVLGAHPAAVTHTGASGLTAATGASGSAGSADAAGVPAAGSAATTSAGAAAPARTTGGLAFTGLETAVPLAALVLIAGGAGAAALARRRRP
jgi:hypothetical protein